MITRTIKQIAVDLGDLVTEKNESYGDSTITSAQMLEIHYPNGVPVSAYRNMLLLVRIFDKTKRIANCKEAFGESPFTDIAGYGILGIRGDEMETESHTINIPPLPSTSIPDSGEFLDPDRT